MRHIHINKSFLDLTLLIVELDPTLLNLTPLFESKFPFDIPKNEFKYGNDKLPHYLCWYVCS